MTGADELIEAADELYQVWQANQFWQNGVDQLTHQGDT